MDTKWEISKVSTPAEIFFKISIELPRPVGFVLFGVDCDLKDVIYRECCKQISELASGFIANVGDTSSYGSLFGSATLRRIRRPLKKGRNVIVTMSGDASGLHQQRHQVVSMLRASGAASIVGIYAKCAMSYLTLDHNLSKGETAKLLRQLKVLLNDPPTPDGLDYFLTVDVDRRVRAAGK